MLLWAPCGWSCFVNAVFLSYQVRRGNAATTTNEQRQQPQLQQLGSNCYYTMPGLCSTDNVEFFRIVRLVYVKPTTSPVSDIEIELPSIIYPISYETFIPDMVQRQDIASSSLTPSSPVRLRVNKMKDTFNKVAAFLHQSGITRYLHKRIRHSYNNYKLLCSIF